MATLRDLEQAYQDAIEKKGKAAIKLSTARANKDVWSPKYVAAKQNYDRVRSKMCGNWKLFYWSDAKAPNCDIEKNAYVASASHKAPATAWSVFPGIKANYSSAMVVYDSAMEAYLEAKKDAQIASDDLIEYKKNNMTQSQLEDQLELEQKEKMFGLKTSIWKWIAIGSGVLIFLFIAWWMLRRFKIKIPKIASPVPTMGV